MIAKASIVQESERDLEMLNEELLEVIKKFAAKANENGDMSFMDALDVVTRSQSEKSCVEDCVNWFCEVRKELVENENGKTKSVKKFPHAKVVADKTYNVQIVKAYADAYTVALEAKETDKDESYAEVHNAVADVLVKYFDNLYIDYMSERYGDDFNAAFCEYEDVKAAEEEAAQTLKELRAAKQSVSRLKKGKDADKLAEAEEHLADVQAKAMDLGLLEMQKDEDK